jgi:hypothetical protein
MRIDGNGRVAGPRGSSATGKSPDGGSRFSLDIGESLQDAAAPRAAAAVAGLDAMLALQGVEEAGEKRRRLMRRGRSLLDVLDALKLGLLDFASPADTLGRLSALVREGRERAEDPGLESVLNEIDLRAAVELAKLERKAS